MTRRKHAIMAFGLAFVLTMVGLQQVWLYKWVSDEKIAFWFPFLLLIPLPNELLRLFLSSVQFPLFAIAFCFGIRRFKAIPTLAMLLFIYALCVLAGFVAIKLG